MRVTTGTVIAGKVVLNESDVAEGTDVWVVSPDHDGAVYLSEQELAELEAGIAEADRGEMIDGQSFFAGISRPT